MKLADAANQLIEFAIALQSRGRPNTEEEQKKVMKEALAILTYAFTAFAAEGGVVTDEALLNIVKSAKIDLRIGDAPTKQIIINSTGSREFN